MGSCRRKLLAHHRYVLGWEGLLDRVMLIGAWSDQVTVWMAEADTFCNNHLSVTKRSIRE